MTTESYQYRGYDIVPMAVVELVHGHLCETCRLAYHVTIYSLDHGV